MTVFVCEWKTIYARGIKGQFCLGDKSFSGVFQNPFVTGTKLSGGNGTQVGLC